MSAGGAGPGARGAWLLNIGGAALIAGAAVFLAGPFDGGARRAAGEKIEDLERQLAAARKESKSLKTRVTEIRGQIKGSERRAAEGRRATEKFQTHKTALTDIDGQEKALLAAGSFPPSPASEAGPDDAAGASSGLVSAGSKSAQPEAAVEAALDSGFARAEKAVVVIRTDMGSGSGFILEAGGLAVTSYHVIEASSKLTVEIQKRESTDTMEIDGAQVVAVDADRDLALILLPAAPPAVGANERYPTISLRAKPEVLTGETVYALGNPGAGQKILSFTLTKGIVSNPSRVLDKTTFIQTTAPVNPGNSGGPLLDKLGKAVGVVGAKGRNVEAVGFAVPASAVKDLLARRSEAPHAVADGLEAWERKNRPLTALARRGPGYRQELAVKLTGRVDRIIVAPRGGTVFLIDGQAGKVARFNLSTRSIEATFEADTPLAAADLEPGSAAIYLAAPQKKSILRVGTESMKLRDETPLPAAPLGVSWAGDSICVLQAGDAPRLYPRRDIGRREDAVEMEEDRFSVIASSSNRWLCLARRDPRDGPSGSSFELIAYRMADLKKILDLADLRRDAKKKSFPAGLVARISALQKEVDGTRRFYVISEAIAAQEGGIAGEIVFSGEEKVIFGRRIIGLGPNLRVEGTFEPGPYSQDDRPELKRGRDYYLFMDNIFSASPDGRHAATGTHIYAIKSRKPIRLLPFPSRVHAFSHDSKSLYLFDPYRNALYLLMDWETNAPKP